MTFRGSTVESRLFVKLFFQEYYNDIRRLSSGEVQSNLNLTIIKKIRIPFPYLAEQKVITQKLNDYLSVVAKGEKEVQRYRLQIPKLRQSILTRGFE